MPPHHHPISTHHPPSFTSTKSWPPSSTTKPPLTLLRASSTSPTVDKQESDEQQNTTSNPFTDQSPPINSIPIGGCKACGKSEIEKGCNGEGRIQGGIATVPGFGWWPIKAYRPCPGFVATGGRYRRQGQSMDEVAGFGSVPRKSSATATATAAAATETQSSGKKEGPRKFKRTAI